jgi:acylpyruvate hydrolase
MRIVHFETRGVPGIAADQGSGWHGLTQRDGGFPGTLPELIAQGADLLRIGRSLGQSPAIDLSALRDESDRSSRANPAAPRINCARL